MARRIGIGSAIDVVEHAYGLGGTEREWLAGIVRAIRRDIDDGMGAYGFTCVVDRDALRPGPAFATEGMSDDVTVALATMNAGAPASLASSLVKSAVISGSLETTLGRGHAGSRYFKQFMAPYGVADGFSIFAQDGEGNAVDVSSLRAHAIVSSARAELVWRRVGYHLAAALRLRRRLLAAVQRDALLSPDGVVVDAAPHVRDDRTARGALRAAARAIDGARTRALRTEPERALGAWRCLVDGTWSLVDHWESDGKRWIAAYENRPRVPDPRALSPVERAIAQLVSLAASNKEIAFALGLSEGSVAGSVHRILRRFKCRRRVDFIALSSARVAGRIALDEQEAVALLTAESGALAARLTASERAVAELVVAGESNVAIARRRKVSVHTVAKQVRAAFAKLGATSRSDLAKRLLGG